MAARAAGLGSYLRGWAAAPDAAPLLGGPALTEADGATPAGEQRTVRIAGRDVGVTALADCAVDGGIWRTFEAVAAASDSARGIGCHFGEAWQHRRRHARCERLYPCLVGARRRLDAYLDARGAEGFLGPDEEARRR